MWRQAIGRGPPPHPSVVSLEGVPLPHPPPLHPDGWHIRTIGYIDVLASHPVMTRGFAESLGFRIQDIDTSASGSIFELQDRPGGHRQLSHDRHRGNYHGIGRIIRVPMMLFRPAQEARHVLVNFIIVETGTQGGISVGFILDPGFSIWLASWVHDAVRSDPVSQSLACGLDP